MIGSYVVRFRGARALTMAHLVESEIADRKVTRCGRQLGPKEGTTIEVVEPTLHSRCWQCGWLLGLGG